MKRNGFTLIELMIVIVVAGILIGIAIPSFNVMYKRNRLGSSKAKITDFVLRAKSHAASGTQDWQIIFTGPKTLSMGPVGQPPSETGQLCYGIEYSNPMLNLTFAFNRDGTASSNGALFFSIKNDKGQSILFTLIPQIGEVKTNVQ